MGWCALVVVYILWGSLYAATTVIMETLPPLIATGSRFLLAGIVIVRILAWVSPASLPLTRRQFWGAALSGLVLVGGNQVFIVLSLERIPSGLTALLIAAVPLWLVFLRIGSGEWPPQWTVISVVIGFAGVALVIAGSRGLDGGVVTGGLVGGALALVAGLASAVGSWLVTKHETPANPFATVAVQAMVGGAFLLLLGVGRGEWHGFVLSDVSARSWMALGYAFVAGSLVGFSAYIWSLRFLPISTVGTFAYVNPILAVLIGWTALHESFSWLTLLGGAVIVFAVALVVAAEGRRTSRPGEFPPAVPRRAIWHPPRQRAGRRLRQTVR